MFKEKVNARTDDRTHDGQQTMTKARWPTDSAYERTYKGSLLLICINPLKLETKTTKF